MPFSIPLKIKVGSQAAVVAFLFISSALASDRLDAFYAEEFKKFNAAFEPLIQQLDKCLRDMDRFENGEVFLEPTDCRRVDEQRTTASAQLAKIKPVLESYMGWLKAQRESDGRGVSFEPNRVTTSLTQIYYVKVQQSIAQAKRVRKLEDELVREMDELSDLAEELKSKNSESVPGESNKTMEPTR